METSSCRICEVALSALQNSQFWFGLLAGLVLAFVIVLIWKCVSFRSSICRAITIEDSDKGTFTITSGALIAFVRGISSSFKQIDIADLKLVETREGVSMLLKVRADTESDVAKSLGKMRDLLAEEMKEKLGIIDQIKSIDFEVQELVSSEKQA